jgi:hypothetical protein
LFESGDTLKNQGRSMIATILDEKKEEEGETEKKAKI